jgi:acetylornithine deacetylase
MNLKTTVHELIGLLQALIETPSYSKEEARSADLLELFFREKGVITNRHMNNVWCIGSIYDSSKPTLLLNSHHDTVRPNTSYSRDPFHAEIVDGKLFGLGSNDAGGALIALIGAFLNLSLNEDLAYNLIFAATAEEEISGRNGIEALLPLLPKIDLAIVGEPTSLELAVAEKGLLVVDAYAEGISGHAAHYETFSAIYAAAKDINLIQQFDFPKISETLGKVKATVTQIESGKEHNVVPDKCHFVIDVRVTDAYNNQEVFDVLDALTESKLEARSFRLNSSSISLQHPLVKAAQKIGLKTYGSPTISDQALMSFPSVKIGPGSSLRSHTADEFIFLDEIEAGLTTYIQLITTLKDETLG